MQLAKGAVLSEIALGKHLLYRRRRALSQRVRLLDMATTMNVLMHRAVQATPVARRTQASQAAPLRPTVRPSPRGCGLSASRSPRSLLLCMSVCVWAAGTAASVSGPCRRGL